MAAEKPAAVQSSLQEPHRPGPVAAPRTAEAGRALPAS